MASFNYILNITGDCQSQGTGAISIFFSGGTPPYTVQWIDPYYPSDIITLEPDVKSNLYAGVYAVRTNDSTLPVNQEFYINIPVSSGVCCSIVSVQNTTCNLSNGSVTGTSTSLYSSTNFYLYGSGNSYVTSATTNQATVVFGGLSAGTYYMVAQDIAGCTGQSQTFIIEPSLSLNFGLYVVPNSSCGGTPIGKIFVTGQTGQSPYTYLWSNSATTSSVTGLTAGSYSVQVTDSLGCIQTKSGTIVDVPPLGLLGFNNTQPSCFINDGVISMTVSGGTAPFYYSASTGTIDVSYSRTFELSGLSSGAYTLFVTDAGLCTLYAGTSLLTSSGITSVNIYANSSYCSSTNGSITVAVAGGTAPYRYTLIYPGGNSISINNSQTTQIFTALETGTYGVVVQDGASCTYMQDVTVIAQNSFTISTQTSGTSCNQNNGNILVTKSSGGTPPFNYSLDSTVNVTNTNLSAVTFNHVSSGQHTISVTDSTGCTQTTQVYVNPSEQMNFTLNATPCEGGNEGSITAFISSGTPPFQFNWSKNIAENPQQIQVTGLTAGTYSLTIIDANACSLNRTVTINCATSYVSYQQYVMGGEVFNIQSQTKYGLLQMMNEGYDDLTSGNTNCRLISATYSAQVSVKPLGTVVSQSFFTGTTLNSGPSDNLYYNTITTLLKSILGIGNVTIDQLNNQITIETSKTNHSLNGQEIIIKLIIVYDIMCLT
jgi:uncharacterized protein (DUF2141 family)